MYLPINYRTWDFSGQGKNIVKILDFREKEIWDEAFPFQDKRNDVGHIETVVYFALKLLKEIGGERRVVIPAAILHDVGWSQMSRTELDLFFDPNEKEYDAVLRARHQKEGVDLARKILEKLGYRARLTIPVLEIISQHDTRKGFYSLEDGVVRSADRLWRFTIRDLMTQVNERGEKVEDWQDKMKIELGKENYFWSEEIYEMARIELENSVREYLSNRKRYDEIYKSLKAGKAK